MINFKSILPKNSLSGDKKQQTMIAIFILIVFATLLFIYFGFWRSSGSDVPGIPDRVKDEEVRLEKVVEKISFDIDFLRTSRFQDLNIYGEWPLEIGEKGRQNPFLPNNQ